MQLFSLLAGSAYTITLHENSEYLDTGTYGFHNVNAHSIQGTQVVTVMDDGTFSGTSSGVNSLLSGAVSSIGIFPENSQTSEQQLLFLLKVDPSQMSLTSTGSTYTRMSVLFNPYAVKIASGHETEGIDFAAYNLTTKEWDAASFTCASKSSCRLYSQEGFT